MSNPGYSRETSFAIGDLILRLRTFVSQTNHEFWPDNISIRDAGVFDTVYLHSPARLTDNYLLALATHRKGRLATFDKGISILAVRHAKPQNLVTI